KLKITSNLIDFSDGIDKKRNHLTLFDDLKIPSPEQAKESKAIQSDDLETDLVKESSHQERSLISDIKNNASLITSYKSKERGEPQINSSCFSSAINAAISDLKGKEYGCSFENESMPFCNICNSIATQSESSSKDNKNSILLNDKDSVKKKVHFREEIETFLYEPKRCVHHPCVILKSPLSTKGMEEGNQNCKTTFTLEATVEENFHSYVVREDSEEIEEMFLENPNILETIRRRKFAGRRMEERFKPNNIRTSTCLSEKPHRINGWVPVRNEDDRFLLESMDSTVGYLRRMQTEGEPKISRTRSAKVLSDKTAVTTARKQSKEILEKLCKKLFHHKNSRK
ncbi:hypothetical protein TNCT_126681, partial [Trichonephila clavata]